MIIGVTSNTNLGRFFLKSIELLKYYPIDESLDELIYYYSNIDDMLNQTLKDDE